MNHEVKALLAIMGIIALGVVVFVWIANREADCLRSRCDRGVATWLVRDGKCICAEVPR